MQVQVADDICEHQKVREREMRKEQKLGGQNSRNLYTRSVRLYCQPKRGRGWEESERENGGKSGLESLFIYSAGRHGRHF